MTTKELFLEDPLSWTLANEGVSSNNDANEATLRWEVKTFVCDGEYKDAMEKILKGYLSCLGKEQAGAWISGFYGSGKSHLVKVLRYLWVNHAFSDGAKAREVASLPSDVLDLLTELSTRGQQGAGLHAAGGTLKSGSGDVRMRVLQIVFRSVGLPEKYSEASFMMDLRDEGNLETLLAKITAAGKDPATEIGKMHVSKALQDAYLEIYPNHGSTESVGKALREQYPTKVQTITIDEMVAAMRRAIAPGGELPCTLLVLDEVQQFIDNNADVSLDVQEVVEACQKKLDGRVIVVATGQSALNDVPALQKIMGRFPIKGHLKDNDVERVIRTVVLQKKPEHKATIKDLVSTHSGEITRQLKDTRIGTQPGDVDSYSPDFPLLPVRQRFWKHVLHHTDSTGTSGQMRTQLRVTHEACRSVANRPIGAVIPGDFIYDQLASDLLISGELQKRFQEIIEEQKTKPRGDLRSRICATVFLINKLPDDETKLGIRANAEHIADLLTDSLTEGGEAIRQAVPELLKILHEEGVLMDVEDEYRLQTTEGATWEGEYRKKFASIKNDDALIASERSNLLQRELNKVLSGIVINQGDAKVPRKSLVHFGNSAPGEHDGPVIWVRDGFTEAETGIVKEINGASIDDATVFVLVPKSRLDELKSAIASKLAASETISARGTPGTDEGKAARHGIESRLRLAESKMLTLIAHIIGDARVFLAGGHEQSFIGLREGVEDAAGQVVDRLYPRFHIGDSAKWGNVWKQAKEGNPNALNALGYQGDPDKHPVAKDILLYIGSGKSGVDVVKHFTGGEFGWPKDAVDGALGTLVVSGHIGATMDHKRVGIKELDQRSLGKAKFNVEHPILSATEKLQVKKLFKAINFNVPPGEEAVGAREFVTRLKTLADSTGGLPPAPEKPHCPKLIEMEGLSGNDLLHRLYSEADGLTLEIQNWTAIAAELTKRLPGFALAECLVASGVEAGLPGMESLQTDLVAIRDQRSILDDPNPAATVLKAAAATLRSTLKVAHESHEKRLAEEIAKLEVHSAWTALPAEKRSSLLAVNHVVSRPEPALETEAAIRDALASCSLATWRSHTDAIASRCQAALAAAIIEAEPKAKHVSLPGATIKTPVELDAWLASARTVIEETMKDGPAIV
jgi:hypothetical protein